MGKKNKIRKQIKSDYVYRCDKCHITAYEPEPAVAVCPICHKRMALISWPKFEPIKRQLNAKG